MKLSEKDYRHKGESTKGLSRGGKYYRKRNQNEIMPRRSSNILLPAPITQIYSILL